MDSVPPSGMACKAFSMTLVKARCINLRSSRSRGRSGAASTASRTLPSRPGRYGSTISSIRSASDVGSRSATGEEA